MGRSAIIIGATGLIGSELLSLLIKSPDYVKVKVFVRSSLAFEHPKLEQVIINFNELEKYKEKFYADDVFCCLGTTIKKAKTKEKFRKVDLVYPLAAADLALQNGAKQFLIISSMGADKSSAFFYSRVKGELEEKLSEKTFRAIHIFRPSLLIGDRKEIRLGEKLAEWLSFPLRPLLVGNLKKYSPIKGKDVARAMLKCAISNVNGVHIHQSDVIQSLAIQDNK